MTIWRTFHDVPSSLSGSVVVVGNFDGVHRGHRAVLEPAREAADRAGLPLVAVTFDPHPMAVLRPDHAPSMLTSIEVRAELLRAAGVDEVFALPFTMEMAGWSAQEFIDRVLVEALHAVHVVVGANFRFGHRASGDVATLRQAGARAGFAAVGVELDGGPQVWSSTYVRTCLAEGDVTGAAEALGRPFAVRGVVSIGDKRGRELGFPTANVELEPGLAAPADGVYAGHLRIVSEDTTYPAAISVGTNPTFEGERARRVEAYVLDRDDLTLYGVEVDVDFVSRLRGMLRFDGVDELIEAMNHDVQQAREILGA